MQPLYTFSLQNKFRYFRFQFQERTQVLMESNKNLMISTASQEQEQLSNREHGESGDKSFGPREEFPRELYPLDNLPPGYNFNPTDQDLIMNYLKKKINNEPIPYNRIHSVNVYNHNPQKLAESFPSLGDNEWYFFTPRDRKYRNGTRPNRAAGIGYWKATGCDQQIYHNNACIGSKKTLVFYEGKPPKGTKSKWIMKEYVVNQPSRQHTGTNDMLLDNFVLCRIHMKTLDFSENKEQADATKSCKTRKQKTIKSSAKKNQVTHKRVKIQHQGTSQQHNLLPGQHNIEENLESSENKEQDDATKSCKTRKQKTIKSSAKENQVICVKIQHQGTSQQHNRFPGQHNIAKNLESSENKEQVDATMSCKTRKQKTIKSSAKETQVTHKRAKIQHQGTSQQHNLLPGQHNIAEQGSLPVLEPNLSTQQQNIPILQYSLLPENHSFGNNLESYYDLISNDMVDHRPNALPNHDSFGYYDLPVDDICDFSSYSSYCSSPDLPMINNIDHLREDQFSEWLPTSGKELSRETRNL